MLIIQDYKAFDAEKVASFLMPNELAILDLTAQSPFVVDDEILDVIDTLSDITRKSSLYISLSSLGKSLYEDFGVVEELVDRGLNRLHLRVSVDIPAYTYSGVDQRCPELVEIFDVVEMIRRYFPQLVIIPCLECPIDQIHHLGPLITFFREAAYNEILLVPPPKRTKEAVLAYQDLFQYLRMRGVTRTWIPFYYCHPNHEIWNVQTFNNFSGPHTVHFDISNKCTHSCIFCGLYCDAAIENQKKADEKTAKEIRDMMRAMLDPAKGREILETLPESVKSIQFGGAGDPMTHPNFVEFIQIARERGIACEVLSNMDYFTEESIQKLSDLGSNRMHDLHFIANVSGASQGMYLKTRPRQTVKNYDNVVKTLNRLKEERESRGGRGVFVTMMCVLNKINYIEAVDYVEFSKLVGASRIYMKPLEVHADQHRTLLPDENHWADYANKMKQALEKADALKIGVMDRETMEAIVELQDQAGGKQ